MMARLRVVVAPGFPALAVGLAGLAWIALLLLDGSLYGRYLHHGDWSATGFGASICTAMPGGAWLAPLLAYTASWLLMTAAMMLPTTLPLTRIFDRMIVGRSDGVALHSLLIAGYLTAWAGFGLAAYLLDWALHSGLRGWAWLTQNPWAPAAVVLAIAGAFQFSSLKYQCLDKCRTPLGFIMSYWHVPRPRREAFVLGLAHGVYCVGCCWALMLLMFVVGMGNLGWMLVLGLVMATEKNHFWGRHVSTPLGGALLAAAGMLVFQAII
jgi:predicted metal-binding membrane protein